MTVSTAPELADYDDAVARYDPVLGLEVHVELNTATKMFCGCPTTFGGEPNSHVCPTCLGLPGAMPVVNGRAVESAIRIGLAVGASIAPVSRFARKNYFYPDMPKNFQTSQYDEPIAFDGQLTVGLDDGTSVVVPIERAHMEEDTGKSLHGGWCHRAYPWRGFLPAGLQPGRRAADRDRHQTDHRGRRPGPGGGARLRRDAAGPACGIGCVGCPDGTRAPSARTSTCRCGHHRMRRWGPRTETKNVNSLRSVERAVRYEIRRQGRAAGRRWHGHAGDAALA